MSRTLACLSCMHLCNIVGGTDRPSLYLELVLVLFSLESVHVLVSVWEYSFVVSTSVQTTSVPLQSFWFELDRKLQVEQVASSKLFPHRWDSSQTQQLISALAGLSISTPSKIMSLSFDLLFALVACGWLCCDWEAVFRRLSVDIVLRQRHLDSFRCDLLLKLRSGFS